MEKLLTTIPFDGFYESCSGERVEEALGLSDSDYEYYKDENPKKDDESDNDYARRIDDHFQELRDKADYGSMQNEYCAEYVKKFAEDNNIKLEFETLQSPREYNFTTDRIFCYISVEEVARLLSIVDREKLAALIKEKFTSRDGFMSHYSPYIEEWTLNAPDMLDHNEIGTIIECVTGPHIEEENEKYPYVLTLMENFYR